MTGTLRMLPLLLLATGSWCALACAQTPDPDPLRKSNPIPSRVVAARPLEPSDSDGDITSDLTAGAAAPDFALLDDRGHWLRRADLRGRWAAIVFSENLKRLGPLRAVVAALDSAGVRLLGVTVDGTGAVRRYHEQQRLPFTLLSDPTRQVSQLYGMFDPEEQAIAPGIVLLDPNGIVWTAASSDSLGPESVSAFVRRALPSPVLSAQAP